MDHVTQIVISTNNFRGNYGEKGVDLSADIFKEPLIYNGEYFRYDLTRQNNIYNSLGHLIAQSKEYTVDSREQSNDTHLEYINQAQTVDRWGNMLSFTNARGYQTSYEYNALNQVVKQELPEVNVVDEHGVGRILKPVNTYAYDELGQAIGMMDANGHVVSKEYDAMGRVIQEKDAKGNYRDKQYNLLDQLTSIINESGGVTTYTSESNESITSD